MKVMYTEPLVEFVGLGGQIPFQTLSKYKF